MNKNESKKMNYNSPQVLNDSEEMSVECQLWLKQSNEQLKNIFSCIPLTSDVQPEVPAQTPVCLHETDGVDTTVLPSSPHEVPLWRIPQAPSSPPSNVNADQDASNEKDPVISGVAPPSHTVPILSLAHPPSNVRTTSVPLPPLPTPQPPAALKYAQEKLDYVWNLIQVQEAQLANIAIEQKDLLQYPCIEKFYSVRTQEHDLQDNITRISLMLEDLFRNLILGPSEIDRVISFQRELNIQKKQLELYVQEIQQLLQQEPIRPVACLVIQKQPFPNVFFKEKQLEKEQLKVKLLTGSLAKINCHNTQVETSLLFESGPNIKCGKLLECEVNPMKADRTADCPIKFLCGTRSQPVSVKMTASIQIGNVSLPVESDCSNPFIVTTNENQWQKTAGLLLKKDAFGNNIEISWCQFVNTLQRHFLVITRQDLAHPKRPLSLWDLQYFQSQFFGNRMIIKQNDFEAFWEWFGGPMNTLRFTKHAGSLWMSGVLYGFMTRDGAEAPLRNQEPGTFLIRFSEHNAGQFGIAYCSSEPPIRVNHFLVQKESIPQSRSLADFILDKPKFTHLLQLSTDPKTGNQCFVRIPKFVALGDYISKSSPRNMIGNYEF